MAQKEEKRTIVVDRPFRNEGKVLKAGASVTVTKEFANQMVAANKAHFSDKSAAVDPVEDGKKGK